MNNYESRNVHTENDVVFISRGNKYKFVNMLGFAMGGAVKSMMNVEVTMKMVTVISTHEKIQYTNISFSVGDPTQK